MPIKEIIAAAAIIMTGIFVSHPLEFTTALRKVQFAILRDATRVDNWGNPNLAFQRRPVSKPHRVQRRSRY